MSGFTDLHQYNQFRNEIITNRRYIHTHIVTDFLSAVQSSCRERVVKLKSDATLYRAQLGCDESDKSGTLLRKPYSKSRMIPLKNKAKEGRANPKGISCFYCASQLNIAICEVRPWIGSYVTVAKVKTLKPLSIVDCRKKNNKIVWSNVIESPDVIERNAWAYINQAFSYPVDRTDDMADYVPTQILAEAFKSWGYDGIAYESRFGNGRSMNMALFHTNDTEISDDIDAIQLYRIDKIRISHNQADD